MTVEEFQKQWEAHEYEKAHPKPRKGNFPKPGDWFEVEYQGMLLLKYCKCYFDTNRGVVEKFPSKDRIMRPMFDRYFIKTEDGVRGVWSCYRIRGAMKGDEGKPCTFLYDIGDLTPKQVEALFDDGTFTDWSKTSSKPPKTYIKQKKFDVTTIGDIPFSTEYDGVSILAVMMQRPKGNYNYFLNMILHEGGSIDENMIIHKNPNAPDLIKF